MTEMKNSTESSKRKVFTEEVGEIMHQAAQESLSRVPELQSMIILYDWKVSGDVPNTGIYGVINTGSALRLIKNASQFINMAVGELQANTTKKEANGESRPAGNA